MLSQSPERQFVNADYLLSHCSEYILNTFVCKPWWISKSLLNLNLKKVQCVKKSREEPPILTADHHHSPSVSDSFICHHQSVNARSCFVGVYEEAVEWIKTQVSLLFFLCFCSETLEEIADYMLPCKKSAIKTSQGPCLPLSLIICTISKIPGGLINGLCSKMQSCNTGCGLFCLFLQP